MFIIEIDNQSVNTFALTFFIFVNSWNKDSVKWKSEISVMNIKFIFITNRLNR